MLKNLSKFGSSKPSGSRSTTNGQDARKQKRESALQPSNSSNASNIQQIREDEEENTNFVPSKLHNNGGQPPPSKQLKRSALEDISNKKVVSNGERSKKVFDRTN